MTALGIAGHIGIFDGNQVIQAMSESLVIQKVSWENFKSQSQPWDTVTVNYPPRPESKNVLVGAVRLL